MELSIHAMKTPMHRIVPVNLPLIRIPAEPTYSVVEIHNPHLPSSQPEEATSQKISSTEEEVQMNIDKVTPE